MKRNTKKQATAIIESNDNESTIIADISYARFDHDYSELEMELEELELEKEFRARERTLAAKKAVSIKIKKSINNRTPRTGGNKNRDYISVLSGLMSGVNKKSLMADMVSEGWKEITAKSFINSISCIYTAIKGESRKTEGIVYITTQCLLRGEKVPLWGDANSKNYCQNVVKAYQVLTAEKA